MTISNDFNCEFSRDDISTPGYYVNNGKHHAGQKKINSHVNFDNDKNKYVYLPARTTGLGSEKTELD